MTDTTTPDLLPCPNPWCDRPDRLRVSVNCNRWRVWCPCNQCGPESLSYEEARSAWNTRATIEQSSKVADHQPAPVDDRLPTSNAVDDSKNPVGDHQTPPDWTIAEALRLMEWSPNEMGLRKVPASVTPKVVREHALGNMIWAQNTLAHAATLHKLAGLQTAYQATAEAAATHLKTAMDAEAKLALAREALEAIQSEAEREGSLNHHLRRCAIVQATQALAQIT